MDRGRPVTNWATLAEPAYTDLADLRALDGTDGVGADPVLSTTQEN
jgi:hypothetical protein